MATTKNATYKIYNGTDWDTIYFKTSAGQVGETNGTLNFLRPGTHKVNGKSFWSGSTHQGITLYATDIKMSSATDASTISGAIDDLHASQDTISGQLDNMSQNYENRITALEGVVSGSEGGSLADIYQTKADAATQHDDLLDEVDGKLAGYATYAAIQTAKEGAISSAKNYTDGAISALVDGAPEALDTLDELAEALKDNKDIVTVLENAIGEKVNMTDFGQHVDAFDAFVNTTYANHNHDSKYEPVFTGTNKSRVLVSNSSGKLSESSITTTQLGYLTDVTSNIQAQLNGKASDTHDHSGVYEPVFTGTNKNRVLVSNSNGNIAESSLTITNVRQIFDGSTAPTTGMVEGDIWISY